MTDCMVLQNCVMVTENVNVTLPNATSPTLIWAGTYLDYVDNATALSLLPMSLKVKMAERGRERGGGEAGQSGGEEGRQDRGEERQDRGGKAGQWGSTDSSQAVD